MNLGTSDAPATFEYSPTATDEPALTIIEAVAQIKGTQLTELDPLDMVIDTDALATLFQGDRDDFYRSSARTAPAGTMVTFRYEGCEVSVRKGRIRVWPD